MLSEWLGTSVSLVASVGSDPGRAEFFADATDDVSQAIEWTMPAHRFVDAAPLWCSPHRRCAPARLYTQVVLGTRAASANILIDLEGEGWAEDEWIGQPLRVGTATLVATQQCIRCTVVTRSQPGLDVDVDVFRTLARPHVGRFGVWSEVLMAGEVSRGDVASLAATGSTEPRLPVS